VLSFGLTLLFHDKNGVIFIKPDSESCITEDIFKALLVLSLEKNNVLLKANFNTS
jgi:hypothetical protein